MQTLPLSQFFERFPRVEWFLRQPPSNMHGLGHTARVMVWAAVLASGTPWLSQAVWAAACHDLRRQDDGRDWEHGPRAAEWIDQYLSPSHPLPVYFLEPVSLAVRWHCKPDHLIEWDHPLIRILKDADGLDRVRLEDLNPDYLRLPFSKGWIPFAEQLYRQSQLTQSPAEIFRAAVQILPNAGLLDVQISISADGSQPVI
jgi:hypothetical protein